MSRPSQTNIEKIKTHCDPPKTIDFPRRAIRLVYELQGLPVLPHCLINWIQRTQTNDVVQARFLAHCFCRNRSPLFGEWDWTPCREGFSLSFMRKWETNSEYKHYEILFTTNKVTNRIRLDWNFSNKPLKLDPSFPTFRSVGNAGLQQAVAVLTDWEPTERLPLKRFGGESCPLRWPIDAKAQQTKLQLHN